MISQTIMNKATGTSPRGGRLLEIRGLERAGGREDRSFERGLLHVLFDETGDDGRRLQRSLAAASRSHLAAVSGRDLPALQVLSGFESLSGLQPVFCPEERIAGAAASDTIASVLLLRPEIDAIWLSAARPLCTKCGGPTGDEDRNALEAKILQAAASDGRARNLLIGLIETIAPPKKKKPDTAVVTALGRFAACGVKRVFAGGEYFRLEDPFAGPLPPQRSASSKPAAPAVASEAVLERLAALRTAAAPGEFSIFGMLEAISTAAAAEEGIQAPLSSLHRRFPELELRLQTREREDLAAWRSREGYSCKKCGHISLPLTAESLAAVPSELGGLTYSELLVRPASDLLAGDQRFAELLAPLEAAGLASLPLGRDIRSLSSGERLLLAFAVPVKLGYRDLLIVGEDVFRKASGESRELLHQLVRRLLERGNTLLLSEAGTAAELASRETAATSEFAKWSQSPDAPEAPASSGAKREVLTASGERFPIGELSAIVGETASGKSRLLRELASLSAGKSRRRGERHVVFFDGERERAALDSSSRLISLAEVLGILEPLAELFASLPAARKNGLEKRSFRLDREESCCPLCHGLGALRHHELSPSRFPTCGECFGLRLRGEAVEVAYHGKSFADLMALSVAEAAQLLQHHERIAAALDGASLVGLRARSLSTIANFAAPETQLAALLVPHLAAPQPQSRVLLVDETLDFLRAENRAALIDAFREFCAKGGTVIVVSRDPLIKNVVNHLTFRRRHSFFAARQEAAVRKGASRESDKARRDSTF